MKCIRVYITGDYFAESGTSEVYILNNDCGVFMFVVAGITLA